MSKYIAKIPIEDIESVKVYVNNWQKSLSAIKKETGADYIMNGGFFNWNWTACPILKVDSILLANSDYGMWGYAWNYGPDIHIYNVARDTKNFIGGVSLVNPWDGPKAKLTYLKEVGGKRGRTAIAMDSKNLILYCCGDGTSDSKTPEQLRDELVNLDCTNAVMYDGGGSSQCDFKGSKIYSSRIVHNLILVFLKKKTQPINPFTPKEPTQTSPPSTNNTVQKYSGVREAQKALNRLFNSGLSVDGSWGPASRKAMIKATQGSINKVYGKTLSIDGSWGPASKKACPSLKFGVQNDVVLCAQIALCAKRYSVPLNGVFDSDTEKQVKAYQRKIGLTANGITSQSFFNNILK